MSISSDLIAYLADESAFCYAAQKILIDDGGFAADFFRLPGDPRKQPDDVGLIKFQRGPATDTTPRLRTPSSRQEYGMFAGTLEVSVRLLRAHNPASTIPGVLTLIEEKRAIVRACFLRSAQAFTIGRLANFAIADIIPGQSESGVDNTDTIERDAIVERFTISYERVAANWPT